MVLGEPSEGPLDRLLGEVRRRGDLVLGGFDSVGHRGGQPQQRHHDVSMGGCAVLGYVVQRRPRDDPLQRVILRVSERVGGTRTYHLWRCRRGDPRVQW